MSTLFHEYRSCDQCYGEGRRGSPSVRCSDCGGTGMEMTPLGKEVVQLIDKMLALVLSKEGD